jgi:hypothetical protein
MSGLSDHDSLHTQIYPGVLDIVVVKDFVLPVYYAV